MMTFSDLGSVEDCYMGRSLENASDYFNIRQDNYDIHQPLAYDSSDLTCWSFSPLPSPESPLDSPLSSTCQESNSWDQRQQSFGSLMTPDSIDAEFFSPEALNAAAANQNTHRNGDHQQASPSYAAPAMMNSLPRIDAAGHVEDPRTGSSQLGSPMHQSYLATPLTIQPAWGRSLPSHKSTSRTPRPAHKRRKSCEKAPLTSSKTTSSRQRLRSTSTTATNASSSPCTASSFSCSSPPKHARLNHNQVEKQYRNRLNRQFEALLLVLPREEIDGAEKKVSKAEVLVLARKHIKELEQGRKRLEVENDRLGGAMSELKRE